MKILFSLLILLPIICFAEQYELDDLIEIGLENSYDIKNQDLSHKNTISSLRSSWLGLLPDITANASAGKNIIKNETDWSRSSGISLSKSISWDDQTYFSIRLANINKKNSDLNMQNMKKYIAFNVFSKYISILEAQKSLQIQEKNLLLQKKITEQIQVQYDSGDKSLLDLKQSEISLLDYEIAVAEYENDLKKARKNLFLYLNIEDEGLEFSEPDFVISDQEIEYSENIDIQTKRNDLKSSKLSLFQDKLNFFPDLSLTFSYSYDNDSYFDFSNYDDSHTLSLNAFYPISDLLERRESYSRAKNNLKISEIDLQEKENDLKNDYENLLNDIQTLKKSYELYKEKKDLAAENLEMAQKQFQLGIISLLDFDRAKIDFQNAELSYINKHYELMRKQEEINFKLSHKILGKW